MSSRDSGHSRHLSKLRRNLHECTNRKTTFSRPESIKWKNVMLFFSSDGDLKRKNSRTAAPFWPQRDLSVVGSRVDASGQRSIERYLARCFFFRARIIHVDVQCLPSREKREMFEYCRSRERGTSWSRKLSSLRPRITVFLVVSQRTSIWRYKM